MTAPADPDFEPFAQRVCDELMGAYAGRLRTIALLGSRAAGRNLSSSDVDFCLVFSGLLDRAARDAVWSLVKRVGDSTPYMLDLTILDEQDLKKGVKPYVRQRRLLRGEDILADTPLLPRPELLGYFAFSAIYYVWLVRGKPERFGYPLEAPAPGGEFQGYEEVGIWKGREVFTPGFSMLVNLVCCIACDKIAWKGEFYFPSKSETARHYQRLFPQEPWGRMLEDVYLAGREHTAGAIPPPGPDRELLALWCGRILEFENEFLREFPQRLPALLAVESEEIRGRLGRFVPRLAPASAADAAALEECRRILAAAG